MTEEEMIVKKTLAWFKISDYLHILFKFEIQDYENISEPEQKFYQLFNNKNGSCNLKKLFDFTFSDCQDFFKTNAERLRALHLVYTIYNDLKYYENKTQAILIAFSTVINSFLASEKQINDYFDKEYENQIKSKKAE